MSVNRQTSSFLRQKFDEVGLYPNSKHGQNFLIDLNLIELLVRGGELTPNDVVLEVGTGTGSLTAMMAPQAASVITVEIDERLFRLAAEELDGMDNVIQLHQDALKNKNTIHAKVLETVQSQLDVDENRQFKFLANLPYNIATPLISNLLRREPVPVNMTVTIQKELAERIVAKPRTKDYNALSVWVQSLCEAEILREMSPTVFWPRPKVDSAIIRLRPMKEKRDKIVDIEFYHTFVRSLFFHRRKFLRRVLLAGFKGRLDKPHIDEVMSQLKLGPTSRAEEMEVSAIQELSEAMRLKLEEVEANT